MRGAGPARYLLGRAARRCLPASRGCRSRSRLWGCRPPHWHRCSCHCSSGPTSHWDTAGCSRGPATLRGGKEAVGSPFRPSTAFCSLPSALQRASGPNLSDRWVRTHIPPESTEKYAVRRAGARIRVSCLPVLTVGQAPRDRDRAEGGGSPPRRSQPAYLRTRCFRDRLIPAQAGHWPACPQINFSPSPLCPTSQGPPLQRHSPPSPQLAPRWACQWETWPPDWGTGGTPGIFFLCLGQGL